MHIHTVSPRRRHPPCWLPVQWRGKERRGEHFSSQLLLSVVRLSPPLNGVDPLQRPLVNEAIVTLTVDDLRCQVLMRAHERHGPRVCRLCVELHRRWATGEPRVALGRLPAVARQDARDEGRRAGGRRLSPIEESPVPAVESPVPAALIAA
jgi:hypothetical protein